MSFGARLERLLGEPVSMAGSVGGGCINQAARGTVRRTGREIFVKWHPSPPAGMFAAEAAGLRALASADGGCRVPRVYGVSDADGLLVLEWIDSGRGGAAFQESLGRGLAAIHRVSRERYGFDGGDNYIGSTPQPNPDEADWITFFREHRLRFQVDLLHERGRLSAGLGSAMDRLYPRLEGLLGLPSERPALLHGDLWTGNAMAGPGGEAVIYDPAAYYGCREADLAMAELFGSFGPGFRAAYQEAFPLEPGYSERRDLYNLYHLLNHANLFGGGYASQAERIARQHA